MSNIHSLCSFLAQAQGAAPQAGQQGGGFLGSPIIMLVVFVVIFWVLLIRPQRKAQKQQAERLKALSKGDKVITNAGIHGTLEYVGDTTVSLKVADGVTIKLEKNAVVHIDKNVSSDK